MSITQREQEEETEAPEIDTRDLSRGAVTFYEVGDSGAWIEVSEDTVVPVEE